MKQAMSVAYLSKSSHILKLPFTWGITVGDYPVLRGKKCSENRDRLKNLCCSKAMLVPCSYVGV